MNLIPENCSIVNFGVETSGFCKEDEVLQIGAKCGEATFSVYLKPTILIDHRSSDLHKLQNRNGELYRYDKKLVSLEAELALQLFEEFLKKLKKPCILLSYGHFHYNRLTRLIVNNKMVDNFNMIAGFYDATNLFRKYLKKQSNDEFNYKLETLSNLYLNKEKNFEALHDVLLVETLTKKLIPNNDFYKYLMHYQHYKQCVEKIVYKLPGKSELKNDNLTEIYLKMESYKADNASKEREKMQMNSTTFVNQGANKRRSGITDFFKKEKIQRKYRKKEFKFLRNDDKFNFLESS